MEQTWTELRHSACITFLYQAHKLKKHKGHPVCTEMQIFKLQKRQSSNKVVLLM